MGIDVRRLDSPSRSGWARRWPLSPGNLSAPFLYVAPGRRATSFNIPARS